MGFLNPFFLVGILAAGVPLLIHLWSRRRARTIDFSAIRFLVEAHRRSVRRFQLEQWFILLLRALALVCLSLALARPVVHGGAMFAGAQLRTAAAIVLDASASMGYRGVDGVPLDNGRDEAVFVERNGHDPTPELLLAARTVESGCPRPPYVP